MFVGRERELETLERLYRTGGFEFLALYGRRRVGKTSLISQFVGDRPAIFFTAVEDSRQANLRELSRAVFSYKNPGFDDSLTPLYSDIPTALEAAFALGERERAIFVIDEFPYLAQADPSTPSVLQMLIDRTKEHSRLFLIVCGSSLSFMKEQLFDEKSPLYGRRTAQIELKPFDYFDARKLFSDRNAVEALSIYGMTGGVPLYLSQFAHEGSLEELVRGAFLNPSSILYEEPTNLIKQEVRKAPLYNSVLAAIAEGRVQHNEIASAAGITSTELAYYLKELERIGLIERRSPIVGKGRRAIYRLSDNLFRFWYRFVLPRKPSIDRGIVERAWGEIEAALPTYLGPVFEDVCAQWLWRRAAVGELDISFDDIGSWWGNDPRRKEEAEIDLVAVQGKRAVLAGECKWRNADFPFAELSELERRASLIGDASEMALYAFSKTGFDDGCRRLAKQNGNVRLVPFEEMTA